MEDDNQEISLFTPEELENVQENKRVKISKKKAEALKKRAQSQVDQMKRYDLLEFYSLVILL